MTELEQEILRTAQSSIGKAIGEALTGYHSPLQKLVNKVVDTHSESLTKVMHEAMGTVISTPEFKEACINAFHHKVAKLLVTKLEGSVEKTVNTLRQDPTIRAKMVLAIQGIVEESQQSELDPISK